MTKLTRRGALLGGAAITALAACGGKPSGQDGAGTPTDAPQSVPPAMTDLDKGFVDGVGIAKLISDGEVNAVTVVDRAISKAKVINDDLNAIVVDTYQEAVDTAEAPVTGSISGLPSFVKDLHNWKGAQTLYGSRAFKGNIAAEDDAFINTWRKAGMISLGKSTTPEMGLTSCTEPLVTGPTRNPWNTDRIPGGSSGGAAALVAARVVPFAHASDGGGSIRIPATCCGLFGLKPSRGALVGSAPDGGGTEISVNHAVTLTVRDSAALFGIAENPNGYGIGNVTEASTKRLKIAFMPDAVTSASVDAATRAALEGTAQLCRDLGHEVIDWSMPVDGDEFGDKFLLLWSAGAAQFAQQASQFSGKPPGPDILEPWTLGLAANFMSRMGEMDDTVAYLNDFPALYESWFSEFDVILSPTVSTVAPLIGSQAPDGDYDTVMENVLNFASFTSPMNVSGAASMSVPLHLSDDGLPVGSMFSAKKGEDGLLFALAYELEEALPWIGRVPPVSI